MPLGTTINQIKKKTSLALEKVSSHGIAMIPKKEPPKVRPTISEPALINTSSVVCANAAGLKPSIEGKGFIVRKKMIPKDARGEYEYVSSPDLNQLYIKTY